MTVCLYMDHHDCYLASGIVNSREIGVHFHCFKKGENLDIEKIDITENEKVIIINKYFETKDLRKLFKLTENIVWFCNIPAVIRHFDNHFPGRKIDGIRNINKACSTLCWEYYYLGERKPDVIELMQKDFDGEQIKDPNVENLIFGLEVTDCSPDSSTWKVLLFGKGEGPHNLFREITKKGSIIVEFIKRQREKR